MNRYRNYTAAWLICAAIRKSGAVVQSHWAFGLVVAVLACLTMVSGCASFTGAQSSAAQSATRIAVTYGALKFIEKAGDIEAQAARAEKIRAVTLDVKSFASGEAVTIEALQAAIMSRLPPELGLADRVLATELVNAVMLEIRARVAGNIISADQLVVVNQVADWIIGASNMVAPRLEALSRRGGAVMN